MRGSTIRTGRTLNGAPRRLSIQAPVRQDARIPQGGHGSPDDTIFVIQKHRASHLHYDLRLQVGDTLRSWAAPEGPCLDPKVRRFAKQVEDHPLDYAAFEGRIPEGQYGAGEVIVWDKGTWVTTADAETALEKGELKFRLAGEKLAGGWMLKRLPDDPTNWLLIKERDIAVRPLGEYDVLVEQPDSVLSSGRVETAKPARARKSVRPVKPEKIAGARKAEMPVRWKPQLAGQAGMPPEGAEWLHEIKFDGYRTLAFVDSGKVRLITRNGLDWTKRYAPLDNAFLKLKCETAIIDGEIAIQDVRGVTVFSDLDAALAAGVTQAMPFFAFDLVYLDGYDLSTAKLVDRKRALEALLHQAPDARFPIHYSDQRIGDGEDVLAQASELGVEGIVSKQAHAKYVQARSTSWIKVKTADIGEAVVVGFTSSAPRAVASLLFADQVDGRLQLAGKVGWESQRNSWARSEARGNAEQFRTIEEASRGSPIDDWKGVSAGNAAAAMRRKSDAQRVSKMTAAAQLNLYNLHHLETLQRGSCADPQDGRTRSAYRRRQTTE